MKSLNRTKWETIADVYTVSVLATFLCSGPGVFMANHFDRHYCGRCHRFVSRTSSAMVAAVSHFICFPMNVLMECDIYLTIYFRSMTTLISRAHRTYVYQKE